jgi:predicted transcriptional regulator
MSTLREIREDHYISREQLASLAGVSEATIIRMENPKHRTTHAIAEKIIQALGEKTGQALSIDNIDGLNIYNPMRDRRKRGSST